MSTGIIRGSGVVGELPRIGMRQLIEGYNIFPWFRMVIDKIADVAGSAEWTVNIKNADKSLTTLENHPLFDLMENGNGTMSGLAVRKLAFKHYLVAGEFFWLLERNNYGMPIALWPIPPSWVVYAPTFNNDPKAIYKLQFRMWHAEVPAREMVHIYEPNPSMPYGRGSGRGFTLGDELETDEYASKFTKAFFYNSARPDILISSADNNLPLSPETAQVLEQKWNDRLQGWWKAHKPYFLSGGAISVNKISADMENLRVQDLRKFSRDSVLQMFNLPPEALGILENSNRATISEAEFFLTKHCAMPRMLDVRAGLQHRLVPEFQGTGKKIFLGFVSPFQTDKELRKEMMTSMPFAFSFDEIRDVADFPPLADGKGLVHAVPVNMIVTSIEDAVAAAKLMLNPPPGDDNGPTDDEDETNDPPSGDTTKAALTEEQKQKLRLFLAFLESHYHLMFNPTWAGMAQRIAQVMQTVGEDEFSAFGSEGKFEMTATLMHFANTWVSQRGALIDNTTASQLADLVVAAIAAGTSVAEIEAAIDNYFAGMNGREGSIASTETGKAATKAQVVAYKQLGVKGKEWLSVRDDKVRDTHVTLDGTVVPLTGQFESSGATADGPREFGVPEEDINCRCYLRPATISTPEAKSMRWKSLDGSVRGLEQIILVGMKIVAARQALAVKTALSKF